MSAISKIEWTDRTWNPVRGCSVISPGCVSCYAMKQAHRFSGPGRAYEGLTKQTKAGPQWTGTIRTVDDALLEPLSWKKPARIFVNSMSDLFHEGVPDEFIDRAFHVMQQANHHTFQVLTKRADRMHDYSARLAAMTGKERGARVLVSEGFRTRADEVGGDGFPWPLPNVWLGVSAEDQQRADERIQLLLQTPAAVRFLSAEPLLGPINLEAIPLPAPGAEWYGLRGVAQPESERFTEPDDWKYWTRRSARLGWVIVGGESGPKARPCAVAWIRSIVAQCEAAGVACFVKQLGSNVLDRNDAGFEGDPGDSWTPATHYDELTAQGWQGDPVRIRLKDRKGGDPAEWPRDLCVRQFPSSRNPGIRESAVTT